MTRILFWLALVFLVLAAIRSKLRNAGGAAGRQAPGPAARQAPPAQPQVESMLCCAHCGVHFPASENVPAGGRDYCCAAHSGHPVN